MKLVNELPAFPKNSLGLERGSHVFTYDEELTAQFGVPAGQTIPLCYDGKMVRCNNIDWDIDDLVKSIDEGVWEISEEERVPDELIVHMEMMMGRQITARDFWKNFWGTQSDFPERFKLRTSPDMTADDLKAAALAAGKKLFIHAEINLDEVFSNETSGTVEIGGSDNGTSDFHLPLNWNELKSGDRFFLCQITS